MNIAAQPWRNGGGITREVISVPNDTPNGFAWRVSLAEISKDGPFSPYPGVTRTMAVLSGKGLHMRFDNGESRDVLRNTPPFIFAGDHVVTAALIQGPVVNLNAMSTGPALSIVRNACVYDITIDGERKIRVEVLALGAAFDCRVTEY